MKVVSELDYSCFISFTVNVCKGVIQILYSSGEGGEDGDYGPRILLTPQATLTPQALLAPQASRGPQTPLARQAPLAQQTFLAL